MSTPAPEKKGIVNLNIRAVENGYFANYCEDGRSKDRVFYSWKELSDWMLSRLEDQSKVESSK